MTESRSVVALGWEMGTSECQEGGIKQARGNFWGDGYVHYLDGFTNVKLTKLYTLICSVNVNYTSIKLFKKLNKYIELLHEHFEKKNFFPSFFVL